MSLIRDPLLFRSHLYTIVVYLMFSFRGIKFRQVNIDQFAFGWDRISLTYFSWLRNRSVNNRWLRILPFFNLACTCRRLTHSKSLKVSPQAFVNSTQNVLILISNFCWVCSDLCLSCLELEWILAQTFADSFKLVLIWAQTCIDLGLSLCWS